MALIDLGKIKFNWCGTYNPLLAYEIDDVVFYKGSSYIAVQANPPQNLPPNLGWDLMARGNPPLQTIFKDITVPYLFSGTGKKELTPLTITFTPTDKLVKVLIQINLFYEANYDTVFNFFRDNIDLSVPQSPGTRVAGIAVPNYDTDHASTPSHLSLFFLDEPKTDQPVTYRLYHTGANIAFNRTLADTDGANCERGTSRIMISEVLS